MWIKGSHLVVFSQVQVPQEPSRCLGIPSNPEALQGSRRCMPSTWGTMAVSSPKRRLKLQAAVWTSGRKGGHLSLAPSLRLFVTDHEFQRKLSEGQRRDLIPSQPYETLSQSSMRGSGHRNSCAALGGGMNRSSGDAS